MALRHAPQRAALVRSACAAAGAAAASSTAARALPPRAAASPAASCAASCAALALRPRCRGRRARSGADDALPALNDGPDAQIAAEADGGAGACATPAQAPAAAQSAAAPGARVLRFARGRWDLARITCAPSVDALLQLSVDGVTLTPTCVAAVLSRMLRLLRPGAQPDGEGDADEADWTADPRFEALQAVAERQLGAIRRPRSLFITFFALCAIYGHGPGRSVTAVSGRWRLPPRSFVARAVGVASLHGMLPALLPKELVFVLQMCVQARVAVPAEWLADMWEARSGSEWASLDLFSQRDLFSLLSALRRLKVEPPAEWQDAVWRTPAARAWDIDAKTSAYYMTALMPVLRPPPAEWLADYWAESAAAARSLRPGAMVRVMTACGRLEVKPSDAWMTAFWGICAHDLSTGDMKFAQLPHLLMYAAVMDLRPPPAFTEVMFEAAVVDGQDMSEQHVEVLQASVRRMGLQPPKGWALKLLLSGGAGATHAR